MPARYASQSTRTLSDSPLLSHMFTLAHNLRASAGRCPTRENGAGARRRLRRCAGDPQASLQRRSRSHCI